MASLLRGLPDGYRELCDISHSAVIDWAIVVLDPRGTRCSRIITSARKCPSGITFFRLFVLPEKGSPTLASHRAEAYLKNILPKSGVIRYCDHMEGEGELFSEQILRMDLEGNDGITS